MKTPPLFLKFPCSLTTVYHFVWYHYSERRCSMRWMAEKFTDIEKKVFEEGEISILHYQTKKKLKLTNKLEQRQ